MKTLEISVDFDIWLESLPPVYSDGELDIIERAYHMALEAHAGQMRASGEPYITHSLAVSKILAEFGLDAEALAAGLLHDVPEDTPVTVAEIQNEFGVTVARLVDSVTKLNEVEVFERYQTALAPHTRQEVQRAESLRKMFLAMGDDVRVVMIKLADRLHNMRTLSAMPDHKRKRIAQETLEIFAPLANRLGIYQIKRELEDLSFKYLDPEKYQTIAKELDAHQENVNKYIKRIAADLEQTLQSAGIKATLSWRTKHIYSISRKMQRKEADLNDIYDIKALRIIVPEVKDCYAALGVVHTKWRPIPGEFDDYIAAAKDNGYQSLHTAVMDNNGEQFEVQIRTEEMHQQAELGIAAHWRYKDNSRPDEALDRKIATMRQAMKWQEELFDASEVENPHDFVNALKSDVIEERVYVFTPKGDIKDLPLGSTPIDFAYYIHTEVGHKCRGAKVNGKLVGLDYQLANGDKVEILTAKRGGPSRDWLNENLGYVKTSRARSKIKYWFKRQNYQESVVQGRSLLERELKRLNLNGLNTEELSEICGYNTIDDFLAAVGYNDLPIQQVIRKVLEFLAGDKKPEEELIVTTVPLPAAAPARTDSVHVKGMANLLTHLGNCCRPVPGDPIIGYITRGRGVTVHRYDCPNALKVVDRERMIEVSWGVEETKTYGVDIIIRAYDRPGLVRDISHVIANEQVNIQNLDVMTRRKNNTAELLVTLEISALTHLIKLMDKIEQLPNIIYVRRRG